jgi:DnaJ-domain-containing protein 1
VSIGRRILDSVNSVMDNLAADDTPLSHVEEADLRAELQARIDGRGSSPPSPRDNPRAKWAGASAAAREARRRAAEQREARVHKERGAAEAQERAAREKAFREAQAQARSQSRSTGARAGSSRQSSRRRRSGARRPFGRQGDKIAEYYKVLDLPVGAPFADVKKQFRTLMRKYHPDRHVGNPKKQKAATELTMRVTQAYNELEKHLTGN